MKPRAVQGWLLFGAAALASVVVDAAGAATGGVSVAPSTAAVPARGTRQFSAVVGGSTNQAVTWAVNGVPGGAPALGTITPAGLYTAPTDPAGQTQVAVSAVAAASPLSVGAATVTVAPPGYGGPTYYVATTGSDSASGTSMAQAWRTIRYAVSVVPAGGTIDVAAGIYNELVTITRSGSAAAGYITLQAAPGGGAVIDGTGLGVPAGQQGLLTLQDVSYVRVIGLELRNYTTSSAGAVPAGLYLSGASSHIEIRNNHIHDISTTVQSAAGNAFGLAVYGTAATPVSDLIIDGNELDHLVTGSSESLTINGNVQSWQVTGNRVHDNDNIGIDAIGFEGTAPSPALDQARDGWIAGNIVYDITSTANPAYGGQPAADGIYVDGGTDITIERNSVTAADLGIELASEHYGHATTNVTARNNLVLFSTLTGISIGGYAANVGGTQNCTIVNNSLFENDTTQSGSGEFQIQYHASGNLFANNILYAGSQGLLVNSFVPSSTAPAAFEDDLYFTASGAGAANWVWNGGSVASLAAFQRASGSEARGLLADPRFVSTATPDLRLGIGSPALIPGVNLGLVVEGADDYAGALRTTPAGQIGRGAYQNRALPHWHLRTASPRLD